MAQERQTFEAKIVRREGYTHEALVRGHKLTIDEPRELGGDDRGPNPQELLAVSLASCTAVTMEMYAERKGWNIDGFTVDCTYSPAERGCPTKFKLRLGLPKSLTDEQVQRLRVIATKCPVHRTLEGEAMFEEKVARI